MSETEQAVTLEQCDYRKPECAAYGQTVGKRWICNNHICEQLERCWLNSRASVAPQGDAISRADLLRRIEAGMSDCEQKARQGNEKRALYFEHLREAGRQFYELVETFNSDTDEDVSTSTSESELDALRKEFELSGLGDRPHSISATKLKRLIELERDATPLPAPVSQFQYEAELHNRLSLAADVIRDAGLACANVARHFREDVSEPVRASYETLRTRLRECADRLAQPLSIAAPVSTGEHDLPYEDYCERAGDCRACAGVNCTCSHHAHDGRDDLASASAELDRQVRIADSLERHIESQDRELSRLRSAAPATAPDEERDRAQWLRDGLLAARDALVPLQHQVGFLPEQGGYSTAMTPAELQLSKIVSAIDKLLLKDEEIAGLRAAAPPPAAASGRPDKERVWHGPDDEMPSDVELLAVYRNTFSIGNKHELQMIAHKVEAWCVSRELVASALKAVTAATEAGEQERNE